MLRSSFTSALASFGTWFSPIVVSEKTPPSYAGGWGLGGRMELWGVGLTFGMAGSFDRCPTVTFPGGDRQRRGRQNKATRRKDPSSSRRGTKNPGIINIPQSEQKGNSGLG
ncbi:hypothetical protein CPAR01_13974 [Colletotrichum paranaense]|uniref:Uncharacterized protein n=2 Tax=Colletotrichum acutatum species complex TaxID=2707335 RepID=A0AAI9XSU6_9PEZI|nr:uncharacterized protein CPAR01_13974 [Colletotrichum paranaense]KAK1462514.1 hypothetical protein CMEL01_13625 [Colletotrichum melonis]KAK1523121.1 hypothetical protein CPAR01_13974 [Colletotrichum paranaense]